MKGKNKTSQQLLEQQHQIERSILGEIALLEKYEQQFEIIVEIGNLKFEHPIYSKLWRLYNSLLTDKALINQATIAGYDIKLAIEMSKILKDIFSDAYLAQHVQDFKNLIYLRKIISKVESDLELLLSADSLNQFDKLKDEHISGLSGISRSSESEFVNFSELEHQLIDSIYKKKNNSIDGYSFGLKELDVYTNGLQQSKFYVFGGLKKAGKTRFLIHIIRELYSQNVPTAFLSLEIPKYDLYKLLKSSFIGIDDTKLRAGGQKYLTKEELNQIELLQFDDKKIMIECTSGLCIGEVLARIRKYAKLGAKIVFIDFLQRINVDIKNKVNELEAIAQLLANASRELNIGIILLSQLNVLAEKEIPSISHLKGSGGIGEAADSIFVLDNIFRRTGRAEMRNLMEIELTQRYGESGKIKVYANLATCKFEDYSEQKISEEELRKVPMHFFSNESYYHDEELPI
ncbi:MAG: hypothetical protein HYS24_03520 [Ignavibacteriales bacterium]|nr:hypothetical protein [Ignavibacteriales bacterium]